MRDIITFFFGFFVPLTCLTLLSACKPRDAGRFEPFAGAALAHVHANGKGYGSGRSAELSTRFKPNGMQLVQLNPFGYQPSVNDRRILFDDPTLQDEDLIREIQSLHKQGLLVMLAPHLWLDRANNAPWRSQLDYKHADERAEWFGAYAKFILHYARIATQTQSEVFAIGVELASLARDTGAFRRLIGEVRALGYRGLLTYECEAWNAENIAFWQELDFIGLNMYYSFDGEPRNEVDPYFTGLVDFQRDKLARHAQHAERTGMPWVITEFGYPAHQKAISQTSAWPDTMRVRDDRAQEIGFRAFEMALQKHAASGLPRPSGIIFWKYVTTLDSYEKASYATDFILQGKPAEQVAIRIAKTFRGSK
ncbi:MAG: glycoside hydrolase family 113 [Spirochaetota bacterium]